MIELSKRQNFMLAALAATPGPRVLTARAALTESRVRRECKVRPVCRARRVRAAAPGSPAGPGSTVGPAAWVEPATEGGSGPPVIPKLLVFTLDGKALLPVP